MSAIILIDQATLGAGTPGESRSDGLAGGQLVTLTSTGAGTTHRFELLWVPDLDTTAVASLAATGPTTATFSPTAAVYGTYRVRLVVDEGLASEDEQIRLFSIRTPSQGLRIPALNERASSLASLLQATAVEIDASEDNEPEGGGPFAGGNYGGWYRSLRELYERVEAIAVGGDWITVPVKVANYTANKRERVPYDPSGGTFQLNAPAGPSLGNYWAIKNVTTDPTSITVSGNGTNIEDPLTGTIVASFTTGALGALLAISWFHDGTNWVVSP